MLDAIIRKVETTRERLAERFDYDVRKIAAYLKNRNTVRLENRPPVDQENSTSKISPKEST